MEIYSETLANLSHFPVISMLTPTLTMEPDREMSMYFGSPLVFNGSFHFPSANLQPVFKSAIWREFTLH